MKQLLLALLFCTAVIALSAQPVTGVWRGKITSGNGLFASSGRAELKLVARGDSMVGTCYYFSNSKTFLRFAVKGYFDKVENAIHWWDGNLLEVSPPGKVRIGEYDRSMQSSADFSCPNGQAAKLDGKSSIGSSGPEFAIHYEKMEKPLFNDEWDNVIDGYFTGMADPQIIDSVYAIARPYNPDILPVIAKNEKPKKSNPEKPSVPESMPGEVAIVPPSAVVRDTIVVAKVAPPVQKAVIIPEVTKVDTQVIAKAGPAKMLSVKPVFLDTVVAASNTPPVEKPITKSLTGLKEKDNGYAVEKEPVKPPPIVKPLERPVVKVVKPAEAAKPALPKAVLAPPPVVKAPAPKKQEPVPPPVVAISPPVIIKPVVIPEKIDPVAIEKFVTRKKINQGEIPLVGDTIELNFYDNAEVDGDSISLFLNGKLLFNHVLLTSQAYTFKLPVKDLSDGSELTMVAENLGSIPPNTAYMMAIVDGQRYSARLESTEQSSGVIKLVRRL